MKTPIIHFNFIKKIPVLSYKKKVKKYSAQKWEEFDFRQKTYETHWSTKTVPLIFDDDFRSSDPTFWEDYFSYEKELDKLNKLFTKIYGKGFIIRALLVNLPANTFIPTHQDKGESLDKCKRCHIPIITNSKVEFTLGSEVKKLKEGEIWEINNTQKLHSVQNKSNKDRIHLIVDWMLSEL